MLGAPTRKLTAPRDRSVIEKAANNVFTTRSRSRTSVVLLVRERYVRAIPCGLAQCRRCLERHDADAAGFVCSLQSAAQRVVVPGVTCLLHFFDLVEQFDNVVVLQSVLAAVGRRARTHARALARTLARSLARTHARTHSRSRARLSQD